MPKLSGKGQIIIQCILSTVQCFSVHKLLIFLFYFWHGSHAQLDGRNLPASSIIFYSDKMTTGHFGNELQLTCTSYALAPLVPHSMLLRLADVNLRSSATPEAKAPRESAPSFHSFPFHSRTSIPVSAPIPVLFFSTTFSFSSTLLPPVRFPPLPFPKLTEYRL